MNFQKLVKDEIINKLNYNKIKNKECCKISIIFFYLVYLDVYENDKAKSFCFDNLKLYTIFKNCINYFYDKEDIFFNDDLMEISFHFKNQDSIFPKFDYFVSSFKETKCVKCSKIIVLLYFFYIGKISDPNKEYRCYFEFPTEKQSTILESILMSNGFHFKHFKRHDDFILYLNESLKIEDFLTFIGASISSTKIMDIKIYKNIRNDVNRITNCETSNISKTVNASKRHIDDIKYIVNKKGWEYIPDDLIEIALLRFENPEMSLSEMGSFLTKRLSKSALNNRFNRISKIANKIKEGLKYE